MKRALVLLLIYFVISNLLSVPLIVWAIIDMVKNSQLDSAMNPSAMMMNNPIMQNGIGLVTLISQLLMLYFLIRYRFISSVNQGLKKQKMSVLLWVVPAIIGLSLTTNILNDFLNLTNINESLFGAMFSDFWGIAAITVGAPFMEEYLFRGAIQGYFLRQGKSPFSAILASAILFGIYHMNPAQIVFATILGLFFGWLAYRTGSLKASILAHVVNNSVAVVLSYFFPDVDSVIDLMGGGYAGVGVGLAAGVILFVGAVYMIRNLVPAPAPVTEPDTENSVFPSSEA